MKKAYVSLLLNVITLEKTDVIRTSGLSTQDNFTEADVNFDSYFGGE